AANIVWMLDDFTVENGATRIVPGSHRKGRWPMLGEDVDAIPITGRAGSALCFEARTWQQTGPNVTTDQYRHALLTYFCRPWIRQQENLTVSLRPDVVAGASQRFRELVGFSVHLTLGQIHAIDEELAAANS